MGIRVIYSKTLQNSDLTEDIALHVESVEFSMPDIVYIDQRSQLISIPLTQADQKGNAHHQRQAFGNRCRTPDSI